MGNQEGKLLRIVLSVPMNSYNIQFGLISDSRRTHEGYVCNKKALNFTRDKPSYWDWSTSRIMGS